MCVGVPMQVVEVHGGYAICHHQGEPQSIDTALVGECQPGDWLMTFLGAAREKMPEAEARQSLAAVSALEAMLRGESVDLDAAFADLLSPPELPAHLRQPKDRPQ